MRKLEPVLTHITVITVGLLAGIVVGTGMAQYTALRLPPAVWILRHQAEDALFSRVMPTWWALAVLLPAASAAMTRGRARVWFVFATVLAAFAMAITIDHEVPINRMVQQWSAAAPPADLDAIRHSWMRGHFERAGLIVLAFLLATIGLLPAAGPGAPSAPPR